MEKRPSSDKKISRRAFIKACLAYLALLPFSGGLPGDASASPAVRNGFNGRPKRGVKGDYDLVVAKGADPYLITVKAIDKMGGMGKFVARGSTVVIKPNIGWDRTPEQAGNTNPQVVAALIDLAFKAGAKRVNIFDVTCNDMRRCYANSGIEEAARARGANVYFPDDWDTVNARFDYESPLEDWPVLRDAIECDTFINVPILKHHGLSRLTLSMKNLMGVCGGNRGIIHRDIGRKLVDLTDFINPDLTVIDAYRVLVRNGPTGGNLDDVELRKTLIAATDPTLADLFAADFAGVDPLSVPNIKVAVERNFGNADVGKASRADIEV
ncbi:MAG: DUF362 domain-containing protein [Candidatus Omnitrophota bacterium]